MEENKNTTHWTTPTECEYTTNTPLTESTNKRRMMVWNGME